MKKHFFFGILIVAFTIGLNTAINNTGFWQYIGITVVTVSNLLIIWYSIDEDKK